MATIKDRYVLDIDTRGASANLGKLKGALIAVGGAVITKQILDVTATFEDLRDSLDVVTGSAAAGGDAIKRIKDFARTSQFGVEDLSKTFIQLKAAGIEPTEKLLRTFTDTAAVTTDQLGSLEAITALLARTTGGGLGLEELERLADRGIPVYRILKEEIGLTRQELSEFGQTAEGARTITEALLNGLDREFGGATLGRLDNLSTAMSNFNIAIKEVANEFGSGLSPAIVKITTNVTKFLDANKGIARTIGETLGNALILISDQITKLLEKLGALSEVGLQEFAANIVESLSSFLVGFGSSVDSIVNTLSAVIGGLQQAIVAIAPLAGFDAVFLEAGQTVDDFRADLESEIDQINTSLASFGNTQAGPGLMRQKAAIESQLQALEDGTTIVFKRMEGNFTAASRAVAPLAESLRESAEGFRANAEAARIREEFPLYEDAILRIAAAQKAGAESSGTFADALGEVPEVNELTQQLLDLNGVIEQYSDKFIESLDSTEQARIQYGEVRENIAALNDQLKNNTDLTAEQRTEIENAVTALEAEKNALHDVAKSGEFLNDIIRGSQDALAQNREEHEQLTGAIQQLEAQMNSEVFATENTEVALLALREALKLNNEEYDEMIGKVSDTTDEYKKLKDAIEDINESTQDRIDQARDTAELDGLRGIQRELRQIEISEERIRKAAEKRLRQQAEDAGISINQSDLDAIDTATARSIELQQELAMETYNNQRSFATGWKNAFEEYREAATDNSKLAADVFNRFTRGMEDSIVEFARTGKFSMKDFLADIAEMILRSQVQRLIAQIFGGSSLFGGSSNSNFAGGFANGGTIPAGQFGIVGENGPEFINGPANITPMGGSNMVTYNINAVDAPSFQSLVARDPGFIHAVSEQGRRAIPAGRR